MTVQTEPDRSVTSRLDVLNVTKLNQISGATG